MNCRMDRDEIMSFRRGLKGVTIRCEAGKIWVTVAGEGVDHILSAGEEVTLRHRRGAKEYEHVLRQQLEIIERMQRIVDGLDGEREARTGEGAVEGKGAARKAHTDSSRDTG